MKLENDSIYRQFFSDTGQVLFNQYCHRKHLRQVLYRIHNATTAGHLGIVRAAAEFCKRSYFPGFTESLLNCVRNSLTCLQTKRSLIIRLTPPLHELSSLQLFPGDIIQIDLVGPIHRYSRYVLTAIDVFTKYLFAIPEAKTAAKALVSIF